jgi:hypothetical protein
MRNWVAKLFSRRQRPGGGSFSSAKRDTRRMPLTIDYLEDRLAPAISSLPPLGEGLNMPRFPIEAQVRAAIGKDWSALAINISSPTANAALNSNVVVTGTVAPAGLNQVTLQARTDSGALQPVAVNNSQFSFNTNLSTTGSADGSHTVTIIATDQSGRTATQSVTFRLDTVAPTITEFGLDTASDNGTAGDNSTTLATVTLKGKTEAGATVVLQNTNATATADSSGNFTFSNVALAVGSTTFTVRSTDAAGNSATRSQAVTRTVTALTVTVNALTTNDTTPTITGTVTDPTATVSISVGGQTVAATVASNGNWTATVPTALSGTTFTVTATATRGSDTATGTGTVTLDSTAPTVQITANPASPINASSTTITVTFSEVVTNFIQGDITVSGGSLSNFVANSDGKTFTATLTPTADGTVNVNVNANVATDAAGNGNTAATQLSLIFDRVAPTVTFSSSTTDPTSTSPIPIRLTFSEAVADFVQGDLNITNGTVTSFNAVSSTVYDITVTPTANGSVLVNLPANTVHDAAGNSNASTSFARSFDSTAPSANITFGATSPTNANTVQATIQWSENVTTFAVGDLSVTNGTLSNFTAVDGDTYTVVITPTADGTVTLNVTAGSVQDAAGNQNAAASNSFVSDKTAPTVNVSTTVSSPTSLTSIPFTVDFSEDVVTFAVTGLNVTNGTVSNFTKVDNKTYTFNVNPSGDGTVTVEVLAGSASDAAGNQIASDSASIVVDVAPIPSFSTIATPTNDASVSLTITFSEDVTGFVGADLNITNGSVSNFVEVDAHTYTMTITPTAEGLVTIEVPAGVATNSGTGNAAGSTSFTYDITGPTVTISPPANDPTNQSPIPMTITFNENVTGFAEADIGVTNGSISNFTAVDAKTYTFSLTPTGNGTVTVSVAAAVAQDAAGNDNTASSISFEFDSAGPTANFSTTAANPTNNPVVPIEVVFNEDVADFVVGDLFITNGTPSNFVQVDARTYRFNVTATGDGLVAVQIAAGLVHDAAGNSNAVLNFNATTVLTTQPTATITGVNAATNQASVELTITFNRDVTGFTESDLQITNAGVLLGSFTEVDARTYVLTLVPAAEGAVTIAVPASSAQDAAGNSNAAVSKTFEFDTTLPTAAIDTGVTDPTNDPSTTVTVTFSENVTGFTAAGIGVSSNATIDNFTQVDPKTYTFTLAATADGTISISILPNSAQDAAGNFNPSAGVSYVFDSTGPTPTVSTTTSDPTSDATIPYTVDFDEDVVGFTSADVQVDNGSVGNFVQVNPRKYTFDVVADAAGVVTVTVPAGAATDAAGNANVAGSDTITFTG